MPAAGVWVALAGGVAGAAAGAVPFLFLLLVLVNPSKNVHIVFFDYPAHVNLSYWRYEKTGEDSKKKEIKALYQEKRERLNTLGRIVEIVAKKPYAQFLEERLFQPLERGLSDISAKLKQLFDPAGILNPGRMYTPA